MKRLYTCALAVTLLAALAFSAQADEVEVDLNVGRKLVDIGSVTVSNDADNLYVLYEVEESWGLLEVHVDVAFDAAGIEQKRGNPRPGRFLKKAEDLGGVPSYTVMISFGELEAELGSAVEPGDSLVVAAHAAVEKLEEAACIDFEDPEYEEKDEVSAVSTDVGTVEFYMTERDPLVGLAVGDTADLTPEGSFPIIAAPDTKPPLTNIVAFTVDDSGGPSGDPLRDDYVRDDGGTGAGGNLLTDPQDTSQDPLLQHAFSQGLAFVIDASSFEDIGGLKLAAVDLDFNELWTFLFVDSDGEVLAVQEVGPGTGSGDGVAFPVEYSDPLAKVSVWGGNNLGQSNRVGYALDEICLLRAREETAWGGEEPFPGRNWATYLTYTVQSPD